LWLEMECKQNKFRDLLLENYLNNLKTLKNNSWLLPLEAIPELMIFSKVQTYKKWMISFVTIKPSKKIMKMNEYIICLSLMMIIIIARDYGCMEHAMEHLWLNSKFLKILWQSKINYLDMLMKPSQWCNILLWDSNKFVFIHVSIKKIWKNLSIKLCKMAQKLKLIK